MKTFLAGLALVLAAAPAAAQKNLKPEQARVFANAWAGKWTTRGCDTPGAPYVVFVERGAADIVVDFRLPERVLAKNFIRLDTVRYQGNAGGLHHFAYRVESEVPGQARNAFDVVMETDGATKRRTTSSVRVSDKSVMMRDGKLANGSDVPFETKCP